MMPPTFPDEAVLRWLTLQSELSGPGAWILDEPWVDVSPAPSTQIISRTSIQRRTSFSSLPSADSPPPTAVKRKDRDRTPERPSQAPVPDTPPSSRTDPVVSFRDTIQLLAHAESCTRCVLHRMRSAKPLALGGAPRSSWLALSLFAWDGDHDAGGLLQGSYAEIFHRLVHSAGLPPPAVAAVVACPAPPASRKLPGRLEGEHCRTHWVNALQLSGARAVLILDQRAAQIAWRRPVDWPAERGRLASLEGLPALASHHPARLRSQALADECATDLSRLRDLLAEMGA